LQRAIRPRGQGADTGDHQQAQTSQQARGATDDRAESRTGFSADAGLIAVDDVFSA
jgi:hypothetical protein